MEDEAINLHIRSFSYMCKGLRMISCIKAGVLAHYEWIVMLCRACGQTAEVVSWV